MVFVENESRIIDFLRICIAWSTEFFVHAINSILTPFIRVPPSSTHLFHKRTTPFQHQKSLSSTQKTPQFHTKKPSVQAQSPSVQHTSQFFLYEGWNCGVCVEIKGFNVELRDFWGWKGVASVLNWRGCGTKGDSFYLNPNFWTRILFLKNKWSP